MFKFRSPSTPTPVERDSRDDCQSSPGTSVSNSPDSQGSGRKGLFTPRRRRHRGGPRNTEKRPYHSPTHVSPPHDKPMTKNDLYYSLDCEMVGVGPEGLESAVARVTLVNWTEQVVLDTFVKVPQKVTDYRTFVSGITTKDLEGPNAMDLKDVRNIVCHSLSGKILIGHALENDLKALQITHPWHDIRDSAAYPPFMKEITAVGDKSSSEPVLRPRKLKELVQNKLGRDIQDLGRAHDPVEDARAALQLYKSERLAWEKHLINQVATARPQEGGREGTEPSNDRPSPDNFSYNNSPLYPSTPHQHSNPPPPMPLNTPPPPPGYLNAGYPMYYRGRSAPSRMQGYNHQHCPHPPPPPPSVYYEYPPRGNRYSY